MCIRGRVSGAGHSFFVFGRNQYHRKVRTHVDLTFGRIQYQTLLRKLCCAGARNKALRASTLLEAVGVTRILSHLIASTCLLDLVSNATNDDTEELILNQVFDGRWETWVVNQACAYAAQRR